MKLSTVPFKLQTIRYWTARLSASDPGHIRLNLAARAVLSVILAILIMALVIHVPITVTMLAGVLGMLSTVSVNDDTEKERRITTLLLPLSSGLALTLSAFLLQVSHYFVDGLLLSIVFLALYTQQFRSRYFSICMVAFISIYFSALLHMKAAQLPWYYVAILIGVFMAYIVNFILFKDKPDKTLKRSLSSFHIQINLTLGLIIEMIQDANPNSQRIKKLEHNVIKLSEYARMVSGQFDSADPGAIWPGIQTKQLRLYIFDSTMLVQTLFPAIKRLKDLHAFENADVRQSLLKLMQCLKNMNVLNREHDITPLTEAENTLQQLKRQLSHSRAEEKELINWLYLLRRIESIAHHIIDEIDNIQKARLRPESEAIQSAKGWADSEESKREIETHQGLKKGLQPATKKAIQAVAAGVISITLGYLLTPAHQYWILLSGFVVFFGTESVRNTIVKAFNRFAGTLFGAIVGFGMDHLLSTVPFLEVPFIFFCIFMGFYLIPISYALMIFWITMLLAMMYNLLLGGISEQLLASRVIDTLIGAGLGAGATAFLLPQKTKDKVRETMVGFLISLKENVAVHLDAFMGNEMPDNHAHQAFELDEKLQQVKDDATPITRRPSYLRRPYIEHRITVFTAMNYYAKHLVASTGRTRKSRIDPTTMEMIKHVDACLSKNIDTLCQLLQEEEDKKHATVWELKNEREFIERSPDTNGENPIQAQFIYDLYYIWRINKAIVSLAKDLGAQIKQNE